MPVSTYQDSPRARGNTNKLRGNGGRAWLLVKQSITDFAEDGALRLSASVAYYALLALAPTLLLAVGVASLVWGRDAVAGRLVQEMAGLVGEQGAAATKMILENKSSPAPGTVAAVIGVMVLLLGASGVFLQLQDAMNIIWEVRAKPGGGIRAFLRNRLLSLGAMASIGFVLLVSLAISTALSALQGYFSELSSALIGILRVVSLLVSVGIFTILFAALFKFLPDVRIQWRDVWIGASFTAVMFVIGKFLIGLYLGRSSAASAYGVAGSIVVFAIWTYYACVIVFVGAEFTQVFARQTGREIKPASYAYRVSEARQ